MGAIRYRFMTERYEPSSFEARWAKDWEAQGLYVAPRTPTETSKRFVMEMFPYPSGDLHMGHVENYSIADAMARYWRMKGHQVMHPMGFDAFGLPAEKAAMKAQASPKVWTFQNIEKMRSSFTRLGLSYDWSREVISCTPEYYRWNQWIFLKFYDRGLVYRKNATVNWCPVDKTVLAKEQVSTGVCWRCGTVPETRDLTQWYMKTTAYADRLIDDMEGLDWPDSILNQQRHWIGRSRGAEVTFLVHQDGTDEATELPIYTTRPDTLWGATFVVLAPEHPLAHRLTRGTPSEAAFDAFLDKAKLRSEVDRQSSEGGALSMQLPAVAINPVNDEQISVWTADYVLTGYGTGAIMGVPAHDERDFNFARGNGLPVRVVIEPEGEELDGETMSGAYAGPGVMVHSGPFSGNLVDPSSKEGIDKVIEWLADNETGHATINFRLRDWLVSRQRYWGTPIPIVYCADCGEVPLALADLPLELPELTDFTPKGGEFAPLSNAQDWVNVACPKCGGPAERETDTLDTFFDSSWYFLRYCDPGNDVAPFDPALVNAWGPVDQYVGGTEHAVMHLIYARFFTKVFQDMGLLDFPEPFLSLFNQGNVTLDGREMSKSSGHLVEAAETIDRFGADAARTFILFCSPPSAAYDFPADGLQEVGRVAFSWLSRVWRILADVVETPVPDDLERAVHRTIKAVTEDFESFSFNTSIARMMELVNEFSKVDGPVPRAAAETFLKLLAPVAPFITEELWHRYGNTGSIHSESWPSFEESKTVMSKVTMVVQVNGKLRDRIDVDASITEEQMRQRAMSSPNVSNHLEGKEPKRVIAVPPRLINIVI